MKCKTGKDKPPEQEKMRKHKKVDTETMNTNTGKTKQFKKTYNVYTNNVEKIIQVDTEQH